MTWEFTAGGDVTPIPPKEPSAEEWVEFLYVNNDRQGLQNFYRMVMGAGRQGKAQLLDDIFRLADPTKLGLFLPSGMLRGTWRYAKHLPNWKPFRDATYKMYQDAGEDADKVLRGLMEDKEYVDHFGLDAVLFQTHPSMK